MVCKLTATRENYRANYSYLNVLYTVRGVRARGVRAKNVLAGSNTPPAGAPAFRILDLIHEIHKFCYRAAGRFPLWYGGKLLA